MINRFLSKLYKLLKVDIKFSPTRILSAGFIFIILSGAILLSLPMCSASGAFTPFSDALFTATSATCVTGLTTVNTLEHWNLLGKSIILLLIQVGGLGFMTVGTLISLAFRSKIGLRQRMAISEAIGIDTLSGIVRLTKIILFGTFIFEGIGTVFLSARFIPDFGFLKGLGNAVFHSVSAFCNSGMDIIGKNSLAAYCDDAVVNITIMALIIIGGCGFVVWSDLIYYKKSRHLSTHTKIVLAVNAFLITVGALIIYRAERTNPHTMLNMSLGEGVLASMFQSVTTRTAGFYTVDPARLTSLSQSVMILLMFIGGAPGSTAGGIKVTTVGILFFTVLSTIRGTTDVNAFRRRLSESTVKRAVTILFLAIIIVVTSTFVIRFFEPEFITLKAITFETVSAFGTVGLSLGITPILTLPSKIVLILLMYFGRVGIITIMFSLTLKTNQKNIIRYPQSKVWL